MVSAASVALACLFSLQSPPIQLRQDTYGSYYFQAPADPQKCNTVLLLIHGTPAQEDISGQRSAQSYIQRWSTWAAQRNAAILTPAFDQPNFASLSQGRRGLGGGYRGLFGRTIDADAWTNRLLDQLGATLPQWDKQVLLFGHSAGGQFCARYILRHPQRIRACVISSPAAFPIPDASLNWPDGARPRTFRMDWGDGVKEFHAGEGVSAWVRALSLPVYLLVGDQDTERYQNPFPGSKAMDHIEAVHEWYETMGSLAKQHSLPFTWRKTIAPGQPHSSSRLAPWAMEWFDAYVK